VTSWHELWLKRQLRAAQLLAAERRMVNFVEERDRRVIADLSDPHGKRFLFDDFEGMAQRSTSTAEATPGSSLSPSWANPQSFDRAYLSVCAPACTCPCMRCARARRPRWHAHTPPPADPPA
jgi:hypothetical protein